MTILHPVILCGGSGTRLWPSSRKAYPKQFVPLLGEKSLYQGTLERFSAEGFAAPLVMTGEDFRFLAVGHGLEMGEVETQPLRSHQGTLLGHMIAQYLAQGGMYEVGGGMI